MDHLPTSNLLTALNNKKQACKPGSVLFCKRSYHLSRHSFTAALHQPTRWPRASSPLAMTNEERLMTTHYLLITNHCYASLFGLSTRKVYLCPVCRQPGGALLPHLFTLTFIMNNKE